MLETTAPANLAAPREPVDVPVSQPEAAGERPAENLVEADLLIEDVSIDGMCGVY